MPFNIIIQTEDGTRLPGRVTLMDGQGKIQDYAEIDAQGLPSLDNRWATSGWIVQIESKGYKTAVIPANYFIVGFENEVVLAVKKSGLLVFGLFVAGAAAITYILKKK